MLLILNDDALEEHRAEFNKYFEKVVDSTLRFAPTAAENAKIATATKARLADVCQDAPLRSGFQIFGSSRKSNALSVNCGRW